MRVFFTRKYEKNSKGRMTGNSIYYFEDMENINCTALKKSAFRKNILKLEGNDGFIYEAVKTKGNFLDLYYFARRSFFCRRVKYDLVRRTQGSDIAVTIGKISFPERGKTEILTDNHRYELNNEGGGYYSVKKDGVQNALFKREEIARKELNKYCGWYEKEWSNRLEWLNFFMALEDYMYAVKNPSKKIYNYSVTNFKKIKSKSAVEWRPSDYNEAMKHEDEKYLKEIQKRAKRSGTFITLVIIICFLIMILIYIYDHFYFF